MNDLLLKSFSSDEVKTALFHMFPTKAQMGIRLTFFRGTGISAERRCLRLC
jgi:hypothetical protein